MKNKILKTFAVIVSMTTIFLLCTQMCYSLANPLSSEDSSEDFVLNIGEKVQIGYYWENSTDEAQIEEDVYDDYYWVIGNNGTSISVMYVELDIYERYEYDYESSYLYAYFYQDNDNSAFDGENDFENESTNFNGDEFFYDLVIGFDQYNYTMDFEINCTWYNVNSEFYNDTYYDDDLEEWIEEYSVYEMYDDDTGELLIDSTPLDPSQVSINMTIAPEYQEIIDLYKENKTGQIAYSEFSYEYSTYQYAYSWVEVDNSFDDSYNALYTYFDGYTIYEDKNNNNVMDIAYIENQYEDYTDYDINFTASEPTHDLIFMNASSIEILEPTYEDDYISFVLVINDIGGMIVPYDWDIYEAIYENEGEYIYIPYEEIEFYYTWNDTSASLKILNSLGEVYQDEYYSTRTDLSNTGIAVNYDGYSESQANSYQFNDNATISNNSEESVGEFSFKVGTTEIMKIEAKGNYTLHTATANETYEMKVIVVPDYSWGFDYSDSEETGTGSFADFHFSVCLNTWNGDEFEMDPTFTTYAKVNPASSTQSNTTPNEGTSISGYPIFLLFGCSIAILAIIIKKSK